MRQRIKNYRISFFIAINFVMLSCFSFGQGFYFYDNGHYEPGVVLDVALGFGGMNCITDIGGSKQGKQGFGATTLRNTKISGGISFTATYKDFLAARVEFNFGKIEAHDSLLQGATNPSSIGRYQRNLNFRSSIRDGGILLELHPVFLRDYQIYDRYMPRISPYIVGGIGFVSFSPETLYNDRWVNLSPLRLEGQGFEEYPDRKPYSKTALTFPLGVGLRYELSRAITLRLEIIRKMTSSDYLDDVSQGDWIDPNLFFKYLGPAQANLASQLYNRSVEINPPRNTRPRGNPKDNDMYWSFQFKIGLSLNRESIQ